MMMTEGEIVTSYRDAKNKKQQIEILADLNATTVDEIKAILKKRGIDLRSANSRAKKVVIEAADPVAGEAGYHEDPNEVKAKPPLGIAPRNIAEQMFNESRIREIVEAMNRYYDADMPIPQAWTEELKERL